MTATMISHPVHDYRPRERGAVVDLAWEVGGGSVRLSLHTADPLGEYEVTRLAAVLRELESLVHTLDAIQARAWPPPPADPAPADLGPE